METRVIMSSHTCVLKKLKIQAFAHLFTSFIQELISVVCFPPCLTIGLQHVSMFRPTKNQPRFGRGRGRSWKFRTSCPYLRAGTQILSDSCFFSRAVVRGPWQTICVVLDFQSYGTYYQPGTQMTSTFRVWPSMGPIIQNKGRLGSRIFLSTPCFPISEYFVSIPSRKLTYPPKMAFWRWFSFSQGGIC